MLNARRVLLVSNVQRAVLGPTPMTLLGMYNFGDNEPIRGDTMEWTNGESYEIIARIWSKDGNYDVLVGESNGFTMIDPGG